MEFLQLARRLHDYLQQGQHLPARSLFEATDGCKEISREAFDALAKHRMENTGEVSGLFELDFDAQTLSAIAAAVRGNAAANILLDCVS